MPDKPDRIDRIAEIVRKLLAKSRGTTNEHEAATFAEKAQELLDRYNLDMATVEGAEPDPFVNEGIDLGWQVPWLKNLVFGVARANFCRAVSHGTTIRMSVVGERHNVEVVKHLYEYLWREIWNMSEKQRPEGYGGSDLRYWRNGYRQGATATVVSRLAARRAEFAKATEQTAALIHVKDAALTKAFKKFYPHLGTWKGGQFGSSSGYGAGAVAGAGIAIHTPVAGGRTNAAGQKMLAGAR